MRRFTVVAAAGMLLVGGCTIDDVHSKLRADPAELSGFLPKPELLVRQPDTFPFHYFYLNEGFGGYDNVYIAPVSTEQLRSSSGWAEFDAALSGTLGSRVDDLSEYMRLAYEKAFAAESVTDGHLRVVTQTDLPKTLLVETAIVSVVPTKAELNMLGLAANFVVPGIGIVSKTVSGGSITVECRIRDAATGEIFSMYSDTETEPKALISVSGLTWLNSARINIKMIAEQTAKVLSVKDYREVRREFPIRFISLIKDAE